MGNAARRRYHRVIGIVRCFIFRAQRVWFAGHYDRTLELPFVFIEISQSLDVERLHCAGDGAGRSFAPAERANGHGAADGADNGGGVAATRPGVRDLSGFKVGVNAVSAEALQRPLAGRLHLRRTGQAGPDLGGQVFQVLQQLRMGLDLISNFLVGGFHRLAIFLLLLLSARHSGGGWSRWLSRLGASDGKGCKKTNQEGRGRAAEKERGIHFYRQLFAEGFEQAEYCTKARIPACRGALFAVLRSVRSSAKGFFRSSKEKEYQK